MLQNGVLYVASITPLNSKEEIDFDVLKQHIDFLISGGVSGITFCGTTGEFPAIHNTMRRQLLLHAVEHNAHRVKMMAGIGSNTTKQALENYHIAEECGMDSVLLLTPWFEKTGLEAIEAYVGAICAEAKIPVYLYHHPYRTNFNWPVSHILKLARRYPNVIAGIKDSSCDFSRMQQYSSEKPKEFDVFFECPDQYFKAKHLGAIGSIDGLANLLPAESVQAMRGSKEAIEKYSLVRSVLATSKNYIGLLRFGLQQLGFHPGLCFAPNQYVNPIEQQALLQVLTSIGVLAHSNLIQTFSH